VVFRISRRAISQKEKIPLWVEKCDHALGARATQPYRKFMARIRGSVISSMA
jgi:hypothetical protein